MLNFVILRVVNAEICTVFYSILVANHYYHHHHITNCFPIVTPKKTLEISIKLLLAR